MIEKPRDCQMSQRQAFSAFSFGRHSVLLTHSYLISYQHKSTEIYIHLSLDFQAYNENHLDFRFKRVQVNILADRTNEGTNEQANERVTCARKQKSLCRILIMRSTCLICTTLAFDRKQ